jgi:hypothetical protein
VPAHGYSRAMRLLLGASALIAAGATLVHSSQRLYAGGVDSGTLALLPYTLVEGDLPAGWTLYDTRASTNAAVAFGADDPNGTLAALQAQGRVTGLQQTFVVARGSAPPVQLVIELFSDADAAAAALQALNAPAAATVVPDFAAPADLPGALAQHLVLGGDAATDAYTLAWNNGVLLIGATASGAHVDTDALRVVVLVAGEKQAPPPPPTVDAADDARDLATAQAFDAVQLPPDAAPSGFDRGGAYLWSDAQLALDSRAPADAARQAIAAWGRISGEAEFFVASNGTRTTLTTGYALFAADTGASLALHDLSLYSASRQAILPVDAAVQLGDETVALRTVVLWPGGELRDGYVLQWRHGAVVLSVTVVEPANAPPPPYLAAVAQTFDNTYAAASLAMP